MKGSSWCPDQWLTWFSRRIIQRRPRTDPLPIFGTPVRSDENKTCSLMALPMTLNELIKLLPNGETEQVEFKRAFPKNAAELSQTLAAFANTNGGTLLIGVNDGGELVGVENGDETLQRLTNSSRDTITPSLHPEFGKIDIGAGSVVWARVAVSDDLHFVNERIYTRIGPTTRAVSDAQELLRVQSRRKTDAPRPSATASQNPSSRSFAPPPPPRDFEGRQSEIQQLERFLTEPYSLLAVEGISGIGKTALALRFASALPDHGYSAVWFACDPLTTFEALMSSLASFAYSLADKEVGEVVETSGGNHQDRLGRIAAVLSDRPYCVFLDDYQAVSDPVVARLLHLVETRRGRFKVVLTVRSRQSVLNTSLGMIEVHLTSGIDATSCATFLQEQGVSVDAQTAERIWSLTGEGHPKALQFFAARARTIPIAHLLTTLPVFRADLKEKWLAPLLHELPSSEREVILELSVFERFIPLNALCNNYPERGYDSAVVGLIDRFIVESMRAGNPLIHPLVREYCFSQNPDQKQRHHWAAELYLAESGQMDDYDLEALTDYQKECLLAAWSHFIEADDHAEAMQVVRKLRPALTVRGELDQVMLLLDRTTPSTDEEKEFFDIDRARILSLWDSLDEAIGLVAPLAESASARVAREAVLVLATILLERKQPEEAMRLLDENWARFSGPTPNVVKTRFLSRLIEASLALGMTDKALEWASKISRGCEERDDRLGGAIALRHMARALQSMGQSDAAVSLAQISCQMLSEQGRVRETALSKRQLAAILMDQGDTDAASALYREALVAFTSIGDRNNIQLCRSHLASPSAT